MVGRTLGRYRIVGKLGAGAMGEVYRAHDTTLSRDVAVKVLPKDLIADSDRRARLAREARVLASLNHPNVGAIYGFEEADGISALVLELVEGPTLADRLATGPIPVREAIALARQVAQALDSAHERGIVHRDLKPANIKVGPDGVVKVLDFGLAKASDSAAASDADDRPTALANITSDGMILGTAAYMSPEQARGQATDKRTDIWAFGCVVYEMLTAQPAFGRHTVTDTLAAILEREPSWGALPAGTPARLRRLLERCLEKDVKRRLRDIGDARIGQGEDEAESSNINAPAQSATWIATALGCLLLGLAAGWLIASRANSVTAPAVSHLLLDARPAASLLGGIALERDDTAGRWRPSRTAVSLAPDGRTLAFTAQRDGREMLYVRGFDKGEATEIPGTEGATNPFFSPDGAWIGYWSAGALRKVPTGGGPSAKLCDVAAIYGASWGDDDRIVFGWQTTIWRVSANGGAPEELTKRPPAGGEARHLLPQVLPGGKWLLFTLQITINEWEGSRIVAQSLGTGERKVILEGAADARYVPTGHLVFMRLGTLTAAPFDPDRLEMKGAEVAIVPDVMQSINSGIPVALDTGAGQYAFSSSGALVYVQGGLYPDPANTLQWLRRDGSAEAIPAPERSYFLPRLSPDERQLLVGTRGLRDQDLWLYDIGGRTLSRLTTEGRAEQGVWSRDGSQIAFAESFKGFQQLFVMRADGGAAPRQLTDRDFYFPGAWTPDGQSLVVSGGGDIELLSIADRKAQKIVQTRFREGLPDLSPDGKWLAYVSNETGRFEVYVQAFPGGAGKRLISREGGTEPLWSRNGRKLIFLTDRSNDKKNLRTVFEVDVTAGTTLTTGPQHALFDIDTTHYSGASQTHSYDITADASRFLFVYETYPQKGGLPRELHVVQNWFTELKQRVGR